MTDEDVQHSYLERVFNIFSDTLLPIIPDCVWDSWNNVYLIGSDIANEISNADIQYQILIVLITWFVLNLILIKLAWKVFGEDNVKLLTFKDKGKHLQ
ncbi:UBX domain-containing protein 6 [Biomphalaria glabrata]|nr:UBX domain-containing protein 6 [Biomphalaria glabrata]